MQSTNIEKVENLIKKGLDEISSNRKELAIKFWEEALSLDPTLEQKLRLLQNLAKTIWEPFKFGFRDKNLTAEDTELFHLGEKYFHLLDDLTTGMKNRSEISVDALREADETIENLLIVHGLAATGAIIFPGDETLRRLMECGMVGEGEKMEEDEANHRLYCLSKAKKLLDTKKKEHQYWAIDIASRMLQILAFDLGEEQEASNLFVEIVNRILDFSDQDFFEWAQSKNTNKFKLAVIEVFSRAENGIEKLDDSIEDQYKRKTTYYARLAWLLNMKGEPDRASAYAYKVMSRKIAKDHFQYLQMKAVLNACNKPLPLPAEKTGGCFIATAVYGSYSAPEVLVLRRFRDEILHRSAPGRLFEAGYYFISPRIAKMILFLRISEFLRKYLLNPFVSVIKKLL